MVWLYKKIVRLWIFAFLCIVLPSKNDCLVSVLRLLMCFPPNTPVLQSPYSSPIFVSAFCPFAFLFFRLCASDQELLVFCTFVVLICVLFIVIIFLCLFFICDSFFYSSIRVHGKLCLWMCVHKYLLFFESCGVNRSKKYFKICYSTSFIFKINQETSLVIIKAWCNIPSAGKSQGLCLLAVITIAFEYSNLVYISEVEYAVKYKNSILWFSKYIQEEIGAIIWIESTMSWKNKKEGTRCWDIVLLLYNHEYHNWRRLRCVLFIVLLFVLICVFLFRDNIFLVIFFIIILCSG